MQFRVNDTIYHVDEKERLGVILEVSEESFLIQWEYHDNPVTLLRENEEFLKHAKKRQIKKCQGCGKITKFDKRIRDITLSAFEKASGFTCLVDLSGREITWLCSDCYKEVKELTENLADKLGSKDFTLFQILKVNRWRDKNEL